jgi:hypothetical protein
MILLLMAPMQLELQTCTTSLFIEIGSHKFLPGLASNCDPPCSASQVAGILQEDLVSNLML